MWYLIISIPDLCTLTYFILNSVGKSLANSLFGIFAGVSCVLEAASYHGHFNLRYVRSMHIVGCLLQYTTTDDVIMRLVTFPVSFPGFWIESVLTIYEYP